MLIIQALSAKLAMKDQQVHQLMLEPLKQAWQDLTLLSLALTQPSQGTFNLSQRQLEQVLVFLSRSQPLICREAVYLSW